MDDNNNNGAADVQVADAQEWSSAENSLRDQEGVRRPELAAPTGKEEGAAATGDDTKTADEQAAAAKQAADDAAAKKAADEKEAELAKNETPEQTAERHKKEADDKATAEAAAKAREAEIARSEQVGSARATARELAAEADAIKTDLRKELFSDLKSELTFSDGTPIRTIEDAMQIANPNVKTDEYPNGRPLTETEAAAWLLAANQDLAKQHEAASKTIDTIADTLLSLNDQKFEVAKKYGAYLTAHPDELKEIWDDYATTLQLHPGTDIIAAAPVNMVRFYDRALSSKVQAATAEESRAAAAAEAAKKHEAELAKARSRSDRGDIFSAGKGETQTDDDKEWGDAIEAVLGDELKAARRSR